MHGRPPPQKMDDELMPPAANCKTGRPKGSKNKKALEGEILVKTPPQTENRIPGRPKGSKNNPKDTVPKRRRGRPRKDSNS